MAFKFSKLSKERLVGVHPDIVRVLEKALEISTVDFTVLEGVRTLTRQRQLFKAGASKTMNSRHITGHAVDVAPLFQGKVSWDWPLYHRLAAAIKKAAAIEKVDLEWGGDWDRFKDGPHWQLSWKGYPAPKEK